MNGEAAAFHAGRRLAGLIAAGQLPPELLRQAALGRLALPFGDRLLILVGLAARKDMTGDFARATLARIPAAEVARVADQPGCPAEIREYFRLGETGAGEAQEPATEAAGEGENDEPFRLVEASDEERAELEGAGGGDKEGPKSILQKLAGLKVQERARRAMLGTREERMLLVRDASRVVQRAALGSPRLTESDVEMIAAMRNVDDQVLREIGGSRRWRRSLNIIRNLVNNPRAPADVSLPLMKHLFPPDLRRLAVNHNVQEAVRRGAERALAQRAT